MSLKEKCSFYLQLNKICLTLQKVILKNQRDFNRLSIDDSAVCFILKLL